MLTETEAIELVSERLQRMSPTDDLYVLNTTQTVERPFGWLFFYNSQRFLDTEATEYRLAGNGPIIADKVTGEILFRGTTKSARELIRDYEARLPS